jgi:branched-chain amino acid transport system permease protein
MKATIEGLAGSDVRTRRGGVPRQVAYGVVALVLFTLPMWVGAYPLSIGTMIGLHSILALGLVLLTGLAGQVSLGQAMFYGTGAYISALLTMRAGVSPWLAMFAAAFVTGCIAALIGVAVLRLRGIIVAGVTLTVNLIFYSLVTSMGPVTGGATGLGGIPRLPYPGGMPYTSFIFVLIWSVVVVLLIFSLNIVRSRSGRALRVLNVLAGGSEPSAQVLGINTMKYKVSAFVVAAVFASIGGSIFAHYARVIEPGTFHAQTSVLIAIMVIVGGVTVPWGAIIGATLMIGITEVLRAVAPIILGGPTGAYELVAYGVVLVASLLFLPDGLYSLPQRIGRRRTRDSR